MPEHTKEPLINSSGYGKLRRRVVVHLDIPGRQACKACGYLEPIDVFRFEDETASNTAWAQTYRAALIEAPSSDRGTSPTAGITRHSGSPAMDREPLFNSHGYGSMEVAEAAGIAYQTLHRWCAQGVVTPSIADGGGTGRPRRWSATDLDVLTDIATVECFIEADLPYTSGGPPMAGRPRPPGRRRARARPGVGHPHGGPA